MIWVGWSYGWKNIAEVVLKRSHIPQWDIMDPRESQRLGDVEQTKEYERPAIFLLIMKLKWLQSFLQLAIFAFWCSKIHISYTQGLHLEEARETSGSIGIRIKKSRKVHIVVEQCFDTH